MTPVDTTSFMIGMLTTALLTILWSAALALTRKLRNRRDPYANIRQALVCQGERMGLTVLEFIYSTDREAPTPYFLISEPNNTLKKAADIGLEVSANYLELKSLAVAVLHGNVTREAAADAFMRGFKRAEALPLIDPPRYLN